jgi:hypothetical protein
VGRWRFLAADAGTEHSGNALLARTSAHFGTRSGRFRRVGRSRRSVAVRFRRRLGLPQARHLFLSSPLNKATCPQDLRAFTAVNTLATCWLPGTVLPQTSLVMLDGFRVRPVLRRLSLRLYGGAPGRARPPAQVGQPGRCGLAGNFRAVSP